MNAVFPLITAALFAATVHSQVSASVTALAPITVTSTDGGSTSTITQPAGPQPAVTTVTNCCVLANAYAVYSHGIAITDTAVECDFGHSLLVGSLATGGSSSAGPQQLLLELQASTPTPISLVVEYSDDAPAGAPIPRGDVDIGNDGLIEFFNGALAYPQSLEFVLTPQPLQIAVFLEAALAQPGLSTSVLRIRALPSNDLSITTTALGCFGVGESVVAGATFPGRGVVVTSFSYGLQPTVMVFGFSLQPVLLPPNGLQPCLLVPSPDVLFASFSLSSWSIPLPPAVRPAQFWAQSVMFNNGQLLPSNALRIDAY